MPFTQSPREVGVADVLCKLQYLARDLLIRNIAAGQSTTNATRFCQIF